MYNLYYFVFASFLYVMRIKTLDMRGTGDNKAYRGDHKSGRTQKKDPCEIIVLIYYPPFSSVSEGYFEE